MPKTKLEMARRHVVEGRERIRRQQALIERLTAGGHSKILEQAEALLIELRQFQDMAEAEVAEMEASTGTADVMVPQSQ